MSRRFSDLGLRGSLAWLGVVVFLGVSVPLLGWDPVLGVDLSAAQAPVSLAHPLGTDHLGRDVCARLAAACSAFVLPGLLAAIAASLVGGLPGAMAGYLGGGTSALVRAAFHALSAIPRFVWVVLAASIYGSSPKVLGYAIGLAYAPTVGEDLHAVVDRLRREEFVLANRAHGLTELRILGKHILWDICRWRIARHAIGVFAFALVVETTLAYLGRLGVQEPMPSWGNMLAFEWGHGPWYAPRVLAPGLALWLTLLAARRVAHAVEDPTHGG